MAKYLDDTGLKKLWVNIKQYVLNNKYTHPTTAGYKHIPSGGSKGQCLKWSSNGTAYWGEMEKPFAHLNLNSSMNLTESNPYPASPNVANVDSYGNYFQSTNANFQLSNGSTYSKKCVKILKTGTYEVQMNVVNAKLVGATQAIGWQRNRSGSYSNFSFPVRPRSTYEHSSVCTVTTFQAGDYITILIQDNGATPSNPATVAAASLLIKPLG